MRHQARILADGFDCTCGYSPRFRRVDSSRENIHAAIDEHIAAAERQEQARPDTATSTKLFEDFQAFVNHVSEVPKPGEEMTAKEEPSVPPELLNQIRAAINPFPPREFPVLHEFLRDPGGPQFRDVLSELGKLRRLSR